MDRIVDFLSRFSTELATFVIATLPVSELRGAIPYAITIGGLPWQEAYVIAVIGNFLPVLPILYFIGPVSDRLRRIDAFDKFFTWLFARTRRKGKLIEKFEAVGLVLFVAIPLPVTGAWTGSLAAFLFGLRKPLAIPAIILGICIAGVVVTLATTGVIHFWGLTQSHSG
ncbi:MAG: ligand-binding protein SH3 [Candidatus Latescibacteria bacterium]|nr:ligand-binding protein SH3 [Candidatus Latescibacterota bacterium]NIM21312.1 ligand-binding protein SH3 [Candidatus Latescibacterota bacterium]NIM65493.1 ligand-binding protein SH3 [Candidatus Latescibacterota bacterium]NIO01873.1 ligand-binding protein SH3 [Candidatus Latescibacterota bacterium]NIO28686.1 ligand-binding protein SH3 [Candidatus Latescibacterota bacterium]